MARKSNTSSTFYGAASITKTSTRIVVQPCGRTKTWLQVGIAPCFGFSNDALMSDIADAILVAIQLSRKSRVVAKLSVGSRTFLKAMKVRSFDHRRTQALVSVEGDADGNLTILPWMPDGAGHCPAPGRAIRVLGNLPATEIVIALQKAIARSESFHFPPKRKGGPTKP